MNEPTYSVARTAAAVVDDFFARHLPPPREAGAPECAPTPEHAMVAAMVDAAFWASLLREEGRAPRISLALVAPDRAGEPMRFAHPFPLAADALTRLAPAVERPGIHLGVWPVNGAGLCVWGAARTLPDHCLVLEVVEPGLLVVKYRRGEDSKKFGNVAVLQGDRVRVVDERSARLPDAPALLAALLADAPVSWSDARNELVQLAVSMRGHGRGGLLLVVPGGTHDWRESIVHPVSYEVSPPFSRLADLLRLPPPDRGRAGGRDGVPRLIDAIAGLTAVDGATIMSDGYEVLAFGAKIGRREGRGPVEQVVVTEPVLDDVPALVAPTQLGGTRHLSAAQFVHDQPDALALVASQDGRFTIFAWSPSEMMVHAHRIEVLLY